LRGWPAVLEFVFLIRMVRRLALRRIINLFKQRNDLGLCSRRFEGDKDMP